MTTDHEARAREIVEKHVSYTDLGPDEGLLMTVDGGNDNALVSAISQALREAEEAERERCAKTFDEYYQQHVGIDNRRAQVGADAAASIRGEKDNG